MCRQQEESQLFGNVEKDLTEKFTRWDVDDKGNITFKGHTKTRICSDELVTGNRLTYVPSRHRNSEEQLAHAEFYFAFMLVLKRLGYREITIDVTDIHKSIIAE